ncbi:MAG: DegT/DnrJ/EryC1/StrS family aminotransferase [Acidobacteriota bacterium]
MNNLAVSGGKPHITEPYPSYPAWDENEKEALIEVLESGIWGGYNPKVKQFEAAFSSYHQCRFGITAANGTVTLETALLAAGIGPGDEVIVPPISFIATATAVLRVGAVPVFVDVDGSTLNLDPAAVSAGITPRTRAIIPVHFAGQPADMDELMKVAGSNGLTVIEDCAHAHGATWRGQPVGSFGDLGSFSFQASKNLTAGEGGILTTNDEQLAEAARSICNQGRRTGGAWYEHVRLGTNLRITGWQAAVLLTQLARLPDQIQKRESNTSVLNGILSELESIRLVHVDERVTCHSNYLYLVRLDLEALPGVTKNNFVKALAAEGVPCAAGYPQPLYRNAVFLDHKHVANECTEAERMCADTFWLSHEVLLADKQQVKDAGEAILKVAAAADEVAKIGD